MSSYRRANPEAPLSRTLRDSKVRIRRYVGPRPERSSLESDVTKKKEQLTKPNSKPYVSSNFHPNSKPTVIQSLKLDPKASQIPISKSSFNAQIRPSLTRDVNTDLRHSLSFESKTSLISRPSLKPNFQPNVSASLGKFRQKKSKRDSIDTKLKGLQLWQNSTGIDNLLLECHAIQPPSISPRRPSYPYTQRNEIQELQMELAELRVKRGKIVNRIKAAESKFENLKRETSESIQEYEQRLLLYIQRHLKDYPCDDSYNFFKI